MPKYRRLIGTFCCVNPQQRLPTSSAQCGLVPGWTFVISANPEGEQVSWHGKMQTIGVLTQP